MVKLVDMPLYFVYFQNLPLFSSHLKVTSKIVRSGAFVRLGSSPSSLVSLGEIAQLVEQRYVTFKDFLRKIAI